MSYFQLHHYSALLGQYDHGHTLAPRDYYDHSSFTITSFAIAVIYVIALLALFIATITFICRSRSRRRKNNRREEGDTLGLVLVYGVLLALADAVANGVHYGVEAITDPDISDSAIEDITTSETLVDLFTIGLVSYLLHDRLRVTSEKKSRGLEFANYVLIFIFTVIYIAQKITQTGFELWLDMCNLCYENCDPSCTNGASSSYYNRANIMYLVVTVLYAVIAGYWLALAIVALKEGKRMESPSSLKLFFSHLLMTLPIVFYKSYSAISAGVVDFTTLPLTDAHISVIKSFYFLYRLITYLGCVIAYVNRETGQIVPARR